MVVASDRVDAVHLYSVDSILDQAHEDESLALDPLAPEARVPYPWPNRALPYDSLIGFHEHSLTVRVPLNQTVLNPIILHVKTGQGMRTYNIAEEEDRTLILQPHCLMAQVELGQGSTLFLRRTRCLGNTFTQDYFRIPIAIPKYLSLTHSCTMIPGRIVLHNCRNPPSENSIIRACIDLLP